MKQLSLNRGIFAGLLAVTFAGCSGEALFYRTDGTYTANVATETSAKASMTSTLSKADGPISEKGELRMCDVDKISWSLPGSSPSDLGKPVAIRTSLSGSLCQIGTKSIVSGKMVVWGPAPNSPGTTGVISDEWTVTGTITITDYTNLHPAEPSLNQEVLTERATGTVSLLATTADGRMVKVENGTFTFLLYSRKSEYHPLS
ncbi:MAG TPA: hypothetical protein VM166_00200 [Gemmatimonadaceae bacterium]|nr:hypothetical protein [Gemmatimonadaceae bacterium]